MTAKLVYGGTPGRGIYDRMIMQESAPHLQTVPEDIVSEYEKKIDAAATKEELIEVYKDIVSNNINIVSADGYRVFNAKDQLSILERALENPNIIYILNFNRTLNIRYKVAELFQQVPQSQMV